MLAYVLHSMVKAARQVLFAKTHAAPCKPEESEVSADCLHLLQKVVLAW